MSTIGSVDAPIEIFGGLVTDMAPADLPHGVSPDCQDVIFSSGGVATRPGLQALFGPLAGNPTVNYVKSYITPSETLRTMAQDANGNLYKETTPGTLTQIASGLTPNAYANSTTLFGREYLATSDGMTGNDLPRQYDDTNLDRVSQGGPGGAPTVVDENVIAAIVASPSGATQPAAVAIAASPNGASENGYLVTITTSAAHGLSAGQSVTVAGVGVGGYNGTFIVVSVLSTTQFTYIAGATGLANSGGGTSASATVTIQTTAAHGLSTGQLVTVSGVGVAGYNGTFSVASVIDTTHFTYNAASGGLAASGGGTAAAAGNVEPGRAPVLRDFSDAAGLSHRAGSSDDVDSERRDARGGDEYSHGPLECGGADLVLHRSRRGELFLCGRRIVALQRKHDSRRQHDYVGGGGFFGCDPAGGNECGQFVSPDRTGRLRGSHRLFGAAFLVGRAQQNKQLGEPGLRRRVHRAGAAALSAGLDARSDVCAGGTDEENFVVWGAAYSIVGNGTTATRGLMTQSAVQDSLGAQRIQSGTDYTVRARCARNATLVQGTLHVHLYSASGGINTTGLQLTATQLTTNYVEYSAELTAPLATIPERLGSCACMRMAHRIPMGSFTLIASRFIRPRNR